LHAVVVAASASVRRAAAPAVTELSPLDAEGKEFYKVSRLAMDVVGGADYSNEAKFTETVAKKIYCGPVDVKRVLTHINSDGGDCANAAPARHGNAPLLTSPPRTLRAVEGGSAAGPSHSRHFARA
jgi:hypothetical protein